MVWLVVAAVALVVVVGWLGVRADRRARADLARPGLPARRTQPGRGAGHLGEAPVTVHHRLGGRPND